MGFVSYVEEESIKLQKNWKQILLSLGITLIVYQLISAFFQSIWPLLLTFHENMFYIRYFGPQVWKLSVMTTIHLFFYYVYTCKPKFMEKFRYVEKWPWEVDAEAWRIFRNRTFWNYFINQIVISPFMFYAFSFIGEPLRVDIKSWPSVIEILVQVIIFDFINDFILWFTHVIINHPKLYWIHKPHHEYTDVVSISGEFFHPIEFLINSIATVTGPKLWGSNAHIISYFMWQFTRVYDNIVQNHSGYMLPWRPLGICPFQNGNSFHYWHHDRNIGNFSFNYNFYDRIFGFDSKFQEAKKQGKIKFM
jgi:sterol desaturase/sphingolipid hydroxylase (fatty acid hydroxylase superfamily)